MIRRLSIIALIVITILGSFSACRRSSSAVTLDEAAAVITKSQAETLVLDDLGFDGDAVEGLYTVYAFDNGIPYYTVRFSADGTDYRVALHAESGEILSVDRR